MLAFTFAYLVRSSFTLRCWGWPKSFRSPPWTRYGHVAGSSLDRSGRNGPFQVPEFHAVNFFRLLWPFSYSEISFPLIRTPMPYFEYCLDLSRRLPVLRPREVFSRFSQMIPSSYRGQFQLRLVGRFPFASSEPPRYLTGSNKLNWNYHSHNTPRWHCWNSRPVIVPAIQDLGRATSRTNADYTRANLLVHWEGVEQSS